MEKALGFDIFLSQICGVINGEVSLLQAQSKKIVDIFVLKIRAGHVKKHECFCVSKSWWILARFEADRYFCLHVWTVVEYFPINNLGLDLYL